MMHSPVQIPVCVYKRESLMLVSNDRAFSLSFRHDHVWNIKGTLAGLRTAMIEVVARVPPQIHCYSYLYNTVHLERQDKSYHELLTQAENTTV